ncbi:MAG: metalloregulator ArsR/SmtB family transcription factor [Bacteroidota bacterium]|nr:metalloregulator ArsR/SmtB family transcription factor [Bacteroidota bacterium]MDP3147413.1 metalloregulator ArsR/SmtB family transcription factor [Bacteroidota bacterium]
MLDKTVYKLHAEVCKALAHPLRIEVIDLLQTGELCFSDILETTGGLKSNLSQHLSVMVDSGILKVRKDSRCNYYSLSSSKVAKACSLMREVLIENLKKQQKLHKSILK